MTDRQICSKCGKPLLPGQPVHGLHRTHWECEYPGGATPPSLEEAVRRIDELIERMDILQRNLEIHKRAQMARRRFPNRVDGPGWRRRNR